MIADQAKIEMCDDDNEKLEMWMTAQRSTTEEMHQKERQILVDPISLRESSRREASFHFMLPPIVAATHDPPALPPHSPDVHRNHRATVSHSLPNSASSSPRISFSLVKKKKWKNEPQVSALHTDDLSHEHSSHLAFKDGIQWHRSKSCADARTSRISADEFEYLFSGPNNVHYDSRHSKFSKAIEQTNTGDSKNGKRQQIKRDPDDVDGFKCNALCLYLPSFGKAKPVTPKALQTKDAGSLSISRRVSLEKFECASWASSAMTNENHHLGDGDSVHLYFDLPLELIRTSVNDTTSPVAAGFVFDKEVKGILKKGSSRATSHRELAPASPSSHHVRFSTSSSSPFTPRLRKARDDFNAFLQAQSA